MRIKLKNNVRTTMASREITSWQDLSNRLKQNQGYDITRTSLSRQITQENPAYAMALIEALCNEFQCLPNDLYHIELTEITQEERERLTRRERPFEFGSILSHADDGQPQKAEKEPKKRAGQIADDLLGRPVKHLSIADIRKPKDKSK